MEKPIHKQIEELAESLGVKLLTLEYGSPQTSVCSKIEYIENRKASKKWGVKKK